MDAVALDKPDIDLADLVARAERGERIVLTREGRPVADLIAHRRGCGLDLEAGEAFLRAHGIDRWAGFIPPDFDDPLPEDILTRPLPDT